MHGIDDACMLHSRIYSVGACKQDEQGRFVKAYARKFEGKPNIREAEATGVLEGLKMVTKQFSAFRNRFSNIWLEMIYNLVHHLSNTPKDNTKFGITILKLKLFIIIRPNVMIEIPTTTPSLVCEFIITVISSMYKKKIYKNKIHPYHKLNFNTN
jgi:hypothetical protein